MTEYDALSSDPLSHLAYFTEWGGPAWERLVRVAVVEYLGGDFKGLRVLEVGARYGRMSCLFGLLGARVTGLDVQDDEKLRRAKTEAELLGVESKVEFVHYDGNPEHVPEGPYDIIFCKSVLVLVPDMWAVIRAIEDRLDQNGRIVFIENGRGGPLMRLARRIRHWGRWDYSYATFMTQKHVARISEMFSVERIERSHLPPIYLICGRKKS